MPRRDDIHKILIIGAGPIVIGQACEFDYSGTQACKALKEEGYEIVLVNSNPATIMTDPLVADRTYIEPILPEYVAKIIEREKPDALLPTMGGQTALNTASELAEQGVLEAQGVQMIAAAVDGNGFDPAVIARAAVGNGEYPPRNLHDAGLFALGIIEFITIQWPGHGAGRLNGDGVDPAVVAVAGASPVDDGIDVPGDMDDFGLLPL